MGRHGRLERHPAGGGGAGIRQTLTVLPITAISPTTERYLNDLSPDRQRLPQRSAIYEQR